jgi:cytochrome b561
MRTKKEAVRTLLYALSLAMGVSGATLLFVDGSPIMALFGIGIAFLATAGLVSGSK